jgi:hypothetical protein
LEKEKLDTMENCVYMMKQIKQQFKCEVKFEMNNIVCNFVRYIVSKKNYYILYEEYKRISNGCKCNEKCENSVDECPICYENKNLLETKCKHKFCSECLFNINSCALCRTMLINDEDDDRIEYAVVFGE